MALTGRTSESAAGRGRRTRAAWRAAAVLLLAGCSALGPPPMEPLTATTLETARRQWEAQGVDSYRLVVEVRAPRTDPVVYEIRVEHGTLATVSRDGQPVAPEEAAQSDYSVPGLFDLLRRDLRWTSVEPVGDIPAVDLRAEFEPATGRLVRYRRTIGTSRRRVLFVEVLTYEPATAPGGPPLAEARWDGRRLAAAAIAGGRLGRLSASARHPA